MKVQLAAMASMKLLNDVLASLVDAYGFNAVEEALQKSSVRKNTNRTPRDNTLPLQLSNNEKRTRSIRPSAVTLTKQQAVSPAKRPYVQMLAERFDQKQFLPSATDAREFLILSGKKPKSIKDRSDAFKQVLIVLSQLPTERLATIANSSAYSGPSQLSDISDAIANIGRENRERTDLKK